MLTRGPVGRNYGVERARQIRQPGTQRISTDGQQSYAVSRPTNSPSPVGAPQYVYGYPHSYPQQHNRRAMSGGEVPLSLRPNVVQAYSQRDQRSQAQRRTPSGVRAKVAQAFNQRSGG